MKIAAAAVQTLAVPLPQRIQTDRFAIDAIYHVVLQLSTSDGLTGLGYGLLFHSRQARALAVLLEELETVLVGLDPTLPEAVWKAVGDTLYLAGPGGLTNMALSAVDIAVWDLFGKICGQPLYKLLGGLRNEVPAYTTGALNSSTPEGLQEQTVALLEAGSTAMKLGGTGDPREIVRRVAAVRQAAGPAVKILLDSVEAWSPSEAIALGRMLQEYGIYWLEDPVSHQDYAGMARVAAALDTAICTGEYLYGLDAFRPLVQGGCADIVMIDLRRAGGITAFRKIAALAEAWHLPVVPHFMPEITPHLIAALSNGLIAEFIDWSLPLFEQPVRVEQGLIRLSDRPGLGLQLRADAVAQFAVT